MKILIPTDDCLTISRDFDKAVSFRFLTIVNGTIQKDSFITPSADLRSKYPLGLKDLGEIITTDEKIQDNTEGKSTDILNRCIVFASSVSKESEKVLHKMQYEVFYTGETNIINALNLYIRDMATMESDYCCHP
jgi:hypothetical protein